MSSYRIYVACLASYNNGVLHGRWIDVSDTDNMQEEINEMLRESKFPNVMVEHPDLEKLVEYVERLEEWEERGVPAEVVAELEDHVSPDDYAGCYDDLGAFAYSLAEETGELESIPERFQSYIDWDQVGRDYRLGGDVYEIEHGGESYVFWNR